MNSAWRTASILWMASLSLGVVALMYLQTPAAPADSPRDRASVSCSLQLPRVSPLLAAFRSYEEVTPPAYAGGSQPSAGIAQRVYLGFRACLQCHNSGIQGQIELPGGGKLDLMKEQWVFYKEYPIWGKDDKHGQAYTVLLNERSKSIGKLLGIAEIHRDQRCLACHTGFPLQQMPIEKDGLVERDLAKNLDINLGVSCEGCHGPSGDLREGNRVAGKGWKDPHQNAPSLPYDKTNPWRFLAPEVKHKEFGFYDVRSPASKAKLCASCHIGDVEQGRIVTHEMYAAGHPPLPGFEVETFQAQMPRHWAEFDAKADEVQDLFLKFTNDPLYRDKAYQKKSLNRTRSLLSGALAVAAEYLRFTSQLADEAIKSPVQRDAWPELAVFDCYACHHELKSPGWHQARKPPVGVPGRPALQDWPFTLSKLALKSMGASTVDFDKQLAELRKALGAQPFGNAKEIARPAQAASAWFASKSAEVQKKPVSREAGIELLKAIATTAAEDTLDYDSARQLLWAFQVIDGDLKAGYPEAKKIAALIEPMSKDMFLLNLRTGRKAATFVPGDKQDRNTVEVDLGVVLPFVNRYDPAAFREGFKEIAALLGK